MKIRFAKEEDVEELLSIYAEYMNTAITFEYETPSKEEFLERIKNIKKVYPYIVLEDNNKILGYAYAHEFKERKAYSWSVETTIYMDKNICAKGYGKKLYLTLLELLKLQGVRTACACVTGDNKGSMEFHKRLGFKEVGRFHNAGFKLDLWHDISWYEYPLNDYNIPKAITNINELNKEKLNEILNFMLK